MAEIKLSLKAARVNKGMRQADVADALHVSRPTVTKWESGDAKPSFCELNMLSQIYEIPLDNLLCPESKLKVKAGGANVSE